MAPSIVQAAISLLFVSSAWATAESEAAVLRKRADPVVPTVLPGTWTYQGCYTDPGPRTLSGPTYANETAMTASSCTQFCDLKGYIYAGTEYSSECYCGNAIASTGAVAQKSECSMGCSGNATEACGGPSRLSIYWNGKTPPSGPSTNPGTNGFGFFGCYSEGTTGRTLPQFTTYTGDLTVAKCISACKTGGYAMAGVEYGSECYCGNDISNGGLPAPEGLSACNMLCAGNSTEYCGAGARLGVYKQGYLGASSTSTVVSSTTSSTSTSTSTRPTTTSTSTTSRSSTSTSTSTTSRSSTTSTSTTSRSSTTSTSTTSRSSTTSTSTTSRSSTTSTSTTSRSSTTSTSTTSRSSTTSTSTTSRSSTTSTSTSTTSRSSTSSTSTSTTSRSSSSTSTSLTSTTSSSTSTSRSSTATTSSTSTSGSSTSTSGSSTSTSGSSTTTTSQTSTSTSAAPTLGIKPIIGDYSFQGCYTEGTGARALSGSASFAYTTMTLDLCAANCAGFAYFGVEYGGECYCGNTLHVTSTKAADTDCSFVCPGNAFQYCGAGNRLELYKLTSLSSTSTGTSTGTSSTRTGSSTSTSQTSAATGLPTGWKYAGCYTEGVGGRALSKQLAGGPTNTVESCVAACVNLGYTVAGMEYSEQCFCDNFLQNGAAVAPETRCNMACSGNNKEFCGAGDILSIYNIGELKVYKAPASQSADLPGNWTYQGCYSDNVNDKRALFWQSILRTNNTATSCLNLCAEYGYMAAGMEYGEECYCGDHSVLVAAGSTKQPETDCQVPCSGDKNFYCGGGSRLSYYRWTGTPLNVWNTPTGNAAGSYTFLIGGVVVPLITTTGINNKVVFMEKAGTGVPNATGTYELDLSLLNDFSKAWRPLHVKTDIFCAAGITLPDKAGRQLNIGGWAGDSTFGVRLYWPDGVEGTWGVNDWQENVNAVKLLEGRWYPSALNLANGSVLVIGGEKGSNSAPTPSCEILPPPPGGYAKYLDWLERTDPNNLYPFLWVLPTGGIFIAYYNEARILDEKTFDTIKILPNMPGSVNNFLSGRTYPLEGTGVMLPMYPPYSAKATFMVCGGSANGAAYAIDNCVSTQPEADSPEWIIERMPSQRVLSCITALPDGTYLILNGAKEGVAGFGLAQDPNYQAVLYDPTKPVNQRFSIMATTPVARLYHSESILLPDGRVMVSGSNPEDGTHPEEYRVEVFNLPYTLSAAAAPSFTIANKDWGYAATISINAVIPSGNLGGVKVSMMAAVSSTHGNSMGQRTLFLTSSCSGGVNAVCTLTSPPSSHIAPPGWYQIFVLDNGKPGKANWIRIGGDIADAAGIGNWPSATDFKTPGLGPVV